jgi:hypothetical protein
MEYKSIYAKKFFGQEAVNGEGEEELSAFWTI